MKYSIVHTSETEEGNSCYKWIPSDDYDFSAEYLLKLMEDQPNIFDYLVMPFILTLVASLEANLNDWLIVDSFNKHGYRQYKSLVKAYEKASPKNKLRCVVAVLTDNTFSLREECSIVQRLDKLVSDRNKITHPSEYYRIEELDESENDGAKDKLSNHPLHHLTLEECRKYYEAVVEFDAKFLSQYDNGYIEENELIKELEKFGEQVSKKEVS